MRRGRVPDAGTPDSGVSADAGEAPDAGRPDASPGRDAGVVDAAIDAGPRPDGGAPTARLTLRQVGSGQIQLDGPAVTCPPDCEVDVITGQSVTLTAQPATHWRFSSWSTPSCPEAECPITVVADVALTATFERRTYPLRVQLAGGGVGTVTSTAVGLDCPTSQCEVGH